LRAVAVLSVIAFHAFPGWVQGGFIGVDVFFVISGYLISTIIFENLEQGTFSFAEFYARRIKRIFPALLLVLIASYACGWFVLLADEYKQLGKHMAAGAGFVSNFALWNEAGYFDNSAAAKPLLHLWSLGIEEQFYIVWPPLLWLAWKGKFNLFTITIIIAVLSFYLNARGVNKDAVATFYSPHTRFWELLSGSLLAWVTLYKKDVFTSINTRFDGLPAPVVQRQQSESEGTTLSNVLSFIGFLFLAYGFSRINKDFNFPGAWALLPILGAVLIISTGPNAWLNRIVLSNRVAVWFGLISFPLYLWHWPLLSFARIMESQVPDISIRIFAVLLAVLLAWVTYKLVERPIRLGGHGRAKPIVLVVLMTLVGYAGYNAYDRNGLEFRHFHSSNDNRNAFDWHDKYQSDDCVKLIGSVSVPYCLSSPSLTPTVALIGDSHADAVYYFIANYYAKQNRGLIMLGKGGCPPFLGVERDELSCPSVVNDVVRFIVDNPDMKDVLITGRFAATESGMLFGEETPMNFYSVKLADNPAITARKVIFEAGFSALLDVLSKAGKNVTVVLDLPELDFDPRACLGARSKHRCAMDRLLVEDRQAAYREIVERLRQKYQFKVVDLMNAFCDSRECIAKYDGKILYRDMHHLGIYGNQYLANKDFRLD
jgi:peptidoglycan/LPS O-acetylase OafA/YrhL